VIRLLPMEPMNVATKGGGGVGVVQSAFRGALLPYPPRFCCLTRLEAIGGTRAELSGASSRYGALIISQKQQQPPAIRHLVDSSSRKLKELTTRNLANATGGNGGGVAGGNDGNRGGGGGGDDDWSSSNSGDGDDKLPQQSTGLLAWYVSMTERYPVRTKAITAAILNFLGDLFCQLVIEKNGKLDVKRTAVITFLGLVLVGPTLHIWYLTLSKVVTAVGVKGTVIRLLLDQLVFSPAFIAVFFSSLLTLENRTSDIIPKLQQDWKPAVIANWKLWVPFQFINFLAVPQPLQVAFANAVALAWNIYLSFASHTEVHTATQTSPVEIEMSAPGDQKD
jgi:peroxisomal membrane protein 2